MGVGRLPSAFGLAATGLHLSKAIYGDPIHIDLSHKRALDAMLLRLRKTSSDTPILDRVRQSLKQLTRRIRERLISY